jgi:hypothetical protein
MNIREFLLAIHVIQIKEIEVTLTSKDGKERKVLGKRKWRRMNPYHPLSYVVIVIALIIALLLFGFVGMWREIDFRNPFNYQ